MSASPIARQLSGSEAIPIKKVLINDSSELPSYYSSTPGGTLFSTTPGGTKIVYEKNILMNLRNSPISNTPPDYQIPNVLQPGNDRWGGIPKGKSAGGVPKAHQTRGPPKRNQKNHKVNNAHEDQFEIEL